MLNNLARITFLLVIILLNSKVLAESSQANTLHIDVPFVELHSGPSAGYPVVHIVEKNENIIVLLKRTSWLKVKDKRALRLHWVY